ncbi:MAG: hypothetical protein ACXAAO_11995, partial [Candidatus Thorarchaeota archaeon]
WLLRRNRRGFAVVVAILLLVGVTMIVFRESLRVQNATVEQEIIIFGEERWNHGPYHTSVLMVNSSLQNSSLFIPFIESLEILHFNITPGPVTIIVSAVVNMGLTNVNTTPRYIGQGSGDLIEGTPPPPPSGIRIYYSDWTITAYYEGANSTIRFMYSVWSTEYSEYTVIRNNTIIDTANIFGVEIASFVGGGLIVSGIIALIMILESRRVILRED